MEGAVQAGSGRAVDRRLASIGRRIRASRALEQASRFALLGAPIGLAVSLARRLLSLETREAAILAAAPVLLGLLAGALSGLLRPVRREALAALADERAGLGALLATSLELESGEHPFRALVLAEAERAAEDVAPSAVAEIAVPRTASALLLALALGAVLLLLPPIQLASTPPASEDAPVSLDEKGLDAVSRAGAKLRAAGAALPRGEGRRALDEAGRDVQRLLADLESGKLGRREALARLGSAEEALREERSREDARSAARHALEESPALKALADAAARGTALDEAALRALAGKLDRDPHGRDEARDALDHAARAVADEPALQDALEGAARSLDAAKAGEEASTKPALTELARALASTPTAARDEETRSELSSVSKELERARAALARESASSGAKKDGEPGKPVELANGNEPPPNAPTPPSPALPLRGREDSAQGPLRGREDSAQVPPRGTENPPGPSEGEKPASMPLSPELAADLVKLFPPELLAEALKLGVKLGADKDRPQAPPQVSPQDVERFLEKMPEDTLRKLAKAVGEVAKDLPPPAAGAQRPSISPEVAERLARKIPEDVLRDVQRDVQRAARTEASEDTGSRAPARAGSSGNPREPNGPGEDRGISSKDGTSHRDPSRPRTTGAKTADATGTPGNGDATTPGKSEGPSSDDSRETRTSSKEGGLPVSGEARATADGGPRGAGERGRALVPWREVPPGELPPSYAEAAKSALERQRVPKAYERVVRDYFDIPKKP